MKSKTFKEWNELGYRVMKGEHATGRNPKGEATFTRDQVEEDYRYDHADPRED